MIALLTAAVGAPQHPGRAMPSQPQGSANLQDREPPDGDRLWGGGGGG
eukprot:SAG31_NODE_7548_length_1658_cov_1.973701_3_plen_47_part_01